jgi:cysteine desulfurase
MSQIYFDHAATTSMVAPAIKALAENAAQLGNASSLHSAGRNVRKNLEQAREEIAAIADCFSSEIIFTASGTEANNLAIKGLYWRARKSGKEIIVTSAFEHHAVMDPIHWLVEHEDAQLIKVDVDEAGVIDVKQFAEIVSKNRDQIALISIMHSNNEIGTLQPIDELVAIAAGIPFHSDCVQSFLKTKFSFKDSGLTAATISAHKVGGPLGVAALILQRGLDLEPILHGGGQERDLRSGTFNAPSIISFAAAAKVYQNNFAARTTLVRDLKSKLIKTVLQKVPDAVVNGNLEKSLPGIVNITFPGTESDGLLLLLDAEGIACSTGSACSAGVQQPSHVLMAIGLSEKDARSSLRFSLSDTNSEKEIEKLGEVIANVVTRSRATFVNQSKLNTQKTNLVNAK